MLHAALAAEAETQFGAVDLHMLHAQGRQPVGAVFAGVLVVAHADEGLVEQLNDGGENLAPAQRGRPQVTLRALPDLGQRFAQLEHVAELRLVALVAIERVIAILFPAAGIAGGGLDVALGIGTDPDVGPCGRDDQRADAAALVRVVDAAAVWLQEYPSLAGTPSRDAGDAVSDVVQSGAAGRLAVF